MIRALLESELSIVHNEKVNSTINELANIQEESNILPQNIIYTAESVPVFLIPHKGKNVYVLEVDNLFKLMESQNQDEILTFKDIKSILCSDDKEVEFDDMALLVKDDIEHIEEFCMSDKSKSGARCEQVMKYTQVLKNVMAEGVNLLVDRN